MMVTKNGVEFKACACGCGEAVSPKSLYKPGHDARHAGQVGREAALEVTEGRIARSALHQKFIEGRLSSEHLQAKALRIALKALDKGTKDVGGQKPVKVTPVEKTEIPTNVVGYRHGTIKVGRWDYPARMTNAGKVERNSKRDGSGSWEPVGSVTAAQTATWED